MEYLVVPVHGNVMKVDDEPSLRNLQSVVGGWIEEIHLGDNIIMVVNEDAYARGLMLNMRATEVASKCLGRTLPIAGDVLFIRRDGDDYAPLPEWFVDRHREVLYGANK